MNVPITGYRIAYAPYLANWAIYPPLRVALALSLADDYFAHGEDVFDYRGYLCIAIVKLFVRGVLAERTVNIRAVMQARPPIRRSARVFYGFVINASIAFIVNSSVEMLAL